MASGFTNRGKNRALEVLFRGQYNGGAMPTNFKIALTDNAAAPTVDTNVLSDLTEITAGNGYTAGGIAVARGVADWGAVTEDDGADEATIKDNKAISWTAAGGAIPSAGNPIRYAVLTDDSVDPEILGWVDLLGDITLANGQTLTIDDIEIDATEPV